MNRYYFVAEVEAETLRGAWMGLIGNMIKRAPGEATETPHPTGAIRIEAEDGTRGEGLTQAIEMFRKWADYLRG